MESGDESALILMRRDDENRLQINRLSTFSSVRTEIFFLPLTLNRRDPEREIIDVFMFFFHVFTKKEKQKTTSSDSFCLRVLVFFSSLCCPQNSTEKADIRRLIFLILIPLTSGIPLSSTYHRG